MTYAEAGELALEILYQAEAERLEIAEEEARRGSPLDLSSEVSDMLITEIPHEELLRNLIATVKSSQPDGQAAKILQRETLRRMALNPPACVNPVAPRPKTKTN